MMGTCPVNRSNSGFLARIHLKTKAELERLLKEIDGSVGLESVEVVHLNDSKKDFNTHLDQHENIGEGKIGLVGLRQVVRHPKLKDKVFILETPRKNQDDDINNLSLVRKLAK